MSIISSDFDDYSNGTLKCDETNNNTDFIIVNGSKKEVFTVINLNGKVYVITREDDIKGDTKFKIYLKTENNYVIPTKGTDEIYDRYKQILKAKVPTDVKYDKGIE